MTLKSNELFKAVRLALTLGVAGTAAIAAQPVFAQEDEAELETITVVGSRIKRTDVETSQPVFVLEREDLQRTGLTTVGDILQDLTTGGAAINTTTNNGNDGQTQVDLRQLGANRTLVLVNGRRWVAGLFGTVDLNTIPSSIIERIEILKDGASAIYGSDAIGGVINITTRDSYDGAEASAYLGESEEGDGRTESYDFTVGSSTEKASVLINVSYNKQEPIFAGDREISRVPVFNIPSQNTFASASPTTPFGRFSVPGRPNQTLDPGAVGCRPNVICPDSVASQFRPFNNNTDGYNFAPDNYLQTPLERTAIFAQARYNITESVSFKTEMLFNQRHSTQLLAPQPLVPLPQISATSIYNPFNVNINGGRIRPTVIGRITDSDVNTFRFGGGFDGAFDLADRSFSWDTNYIYSQNKQLNRKRGFYNAANVGFAVGPSFIGANGVPQCGTPAAPRTDGCVPFNVFGGPTGYTPEMFEYLLVTPHDITDVQLWNYTANITGDLFEMPAGSFAFAAGYEHRREKGFDEPDPLTQSGQVLGDNPAESTSGSQSLDEIYIEFNVPVLKDVAFAQMLEFSVAARQSDYETFGETINPRFGFRWKPIDDLLVRGNWSEGFRTPSLNELFLDQSIGFPAYTDPCSQSVLAINPGATANCRAAGVPVGYEQLAVQIGSTIGGNPNLLPENATNKTLGFVYSPGFVDGLDIALDWFQIEITNPIGSRSADAILRDCYIGGNQSSCALVLRDLTGNSTGNAGQILDIFTNNQNIPGGLETEGYDLSLTYGVDTDFGQWRFDWDTAYVSYYGAVGQPERSVVSDPGNDVGTTSGTWRIKSNLGALWSAGDWSASIGARYLSALDEDCSVPIRVAGVLGDPSFRALCSDSNRNVLVDHDDDPSTSPLRVSTPQNEIEETWYVDLQGTWTAPWNAAITAGIRNVLDEGLPVSYEAFANSFLPNYDIPGRFWYVSYTQKF